MSYEIIIKQKKTVTKLTGKIWDTIGQEQQRIDTQYLKQEEFESIPAEKRVILVNVSGYTPEIEKQVEVEVEVLKQTVEELDLANVIKAINNL